MSRQDEHRADPNLAAWHVPDTLAPLRKLGEGAFGQVWLVRSADQECALKLFQPMQGMDVARSRRRFIRGAELMRDKLDHPNVVKVRAVYGAQTEAPAFLMDYVPGRDLRAFRSSEEQSLRGLLGVINDVVTAVAYAHSRGIVHRDVKPRNVLVTERDGVLRGVLTDFDLAYQPHQNITAMSGSTQSIAQTGTLFMHPEFREHFDRYADSATQLAGRHRSLDYYSVCATLYFTLSGRDPATESRVSRVLGDVEEAARSQIGAHGLGLLYRLVRDTLACPTVVDVPQDVGDIGATIGEALAPSVLAGEVLANVATFFTGGRLRNVTQLRAKYGTPERADSLRGAVKVQLASVALWLLVGLGAWLLGGAPVAVTGLTVLAVVRLATGYYLKGLVAEPPAALSGLTEAWHWLFHVSKVTSWAILLWHLCAMGAFVFVPSVEPWFVDFRDTMVQLRKRLHPQPIERLVPHDAELRPAPLREPPQPGDVVAVLDVETPARWRLESSGTSLPRQLWGVEDFADSPDSEERVLFIKDRLGLGGERQSTTVKLGAIVAADDAVRLFVDATDVGQWLLSEGLVHTRSDVQLPQEYTDAQRAAEEMGVGVWREMDCQMPCSTGSGCREERKVCHTGWHCVPPQGSLAGRRWEVLLLGAAVGGGLSDARVCVTILGRRGCATAQEAAGSNGGKELGLTFTTEQLSTSRATISLDAARGRDLVRVMNKATNLKVVPLSICSGFAIRSEAGAPVRLTLREAHGLR